jgi:hypothetical protein
MDHGHKNDSPPVKGCQAGRDSHDPLMEPLVAKIIEIGSYLDDLKRLVALKAEELERLSKSACLLTRGKAAKLLDVSESQLDRLAAKGEIVEVHIDRRPRIALLDLVEFITARRTSRRARLSAGKTRRAKSDAQRKPTLSAPHLNGAHTVGRSTLSSKKSGH